MRPLCDACKKKSADVMVSVEFKALSEMGAAFLSKGTRTAYPMCVGCLALGEAIRPEGEPS